MFSGLHPPGEKEESGVFFIDRNGKVFEHILEYLRNGFPAIFKFRLEAEPQRSIILYQVHEEAKYFQIPDLINDIRMLVGIDNLANLNECSPAAVGLQCFCFSYVCMCVVQVCVVAAPTSFQLKLLTARVMVQCTFKSVCFVLFTCVVLNLCSAVCSGVYCEALHVCPELFREVHCLQRVSGNQASCH